MSYPISSGYPLHLSDITYTSHTSSYHQSLYVVWLVLPTSTLTSWPGGLVLLMLVLLVFMLKVMCVFNLRDVLWLSSDVHLSSDVGSHPLTQDTSLKCYHPSITCPSTLLLLILLLLLWLVLFILTQACPSNSNDYSTYQLQSSITYHHLYIVKRTNITVHSPTKD